jgi:phage shock protein PspC (stress-responsive transcriptional regulator)
MSKLAGRKLERPIEGRWVAGVAAGLADYFGLDAGLVRVIFVLTAAFGAIGLLAYVAAWLLVPEQGEQTSIAEKIISKTGS